MAHVIVTTPTLVHVIMWVWPNSNHSSTELARTQRTFHEHFIISLFDCDTLG